MRLVGALLFVALTGSLAVADDPKPADPQPEAPAAAKAKVPLRVVRVMAETHQALLYDKNRGTHVLAEVGKTVEGFLVDDVDDDSVTLVGENGVQLVLAAPEPPRRRHREGDDDVREARPARPAKAKEPQPIDPYAVPAPMDPYADADAPVRTALAPGAPSRVIEPGEGGVRTVEAPDAAPVASQTAPDAPVASRTAPAPTAPTSMATSMFGTAGTSSPKPGATASSSRAPSKPSAAKSADPTAAELADVLTSSDTPAPGKRSDGPVVLPRADVDAALANFGSLSGAVHGSFTPAGAKLDSVAATSLFAKAGLRAGDVITSVDGQPMRSLDDAANVYARAGSVRSMTLQITRAGKPMTLRVAIQ